MLCSYVCRNIYIYIYIYIYIAIKLLSKDIEKSTTINKFVQTVSKNESTQQLTVKGKFLKEEKEFLASGEYKVRVFSASTSKTSLQVEKIILSEKSIMIYYAPSATIKDFALQTVNSNLRGGGVFRNFGREIIDENKKSIIVFSNFKELKSRFLKLSLIPKDTKAMEFFYIEILDKM